MKEQITSRKKNYWKSEKITWQWRTDVSFYFVLLTLNKFFSADKFPFFFFPWLIINHKLKCNQAKTFET